MHVGAHELSRVVQMERSSQCSRPSRRTEDKIVSQTKSILMATTRPYYCLGGSMMMIWRSMTLVPVGPVTNSPSMTSKKLYESLF
jgi:hypothetical protein